MAEVRWSDERGGGEIQQKDKKRTIAEEDREGSLRRDAHVARRHILPP